MTDDRILELWDAHIRKWVEIDKTLISPIVFARAIEAECRVPDYVWMIGTKGFMALFATEEAANDWQQMNGTNTPASYIQPVSIPVISAAPKPDPERKHETVPTLAEPSEYAKSFQDMITHGYSFMKDGMRIPPEDVIEPAEPDCECGAVASEHCPACEPVAQEYQPLGPATTEDQKIYDSIAANYSQPVQEPERLQMAQPISEAIMDLVDRLGSEAGNVDPRAWEHLRVYVPVAPKPEQKAAPVAQEPTAFLIEGFDGNGKRVAAVIQQNADNARNSASVFAEHYPSVKTSGLYLAPPDQSAEVSMTPAASIFKDEVARLNAEVERLRMGLENCRLLAARHRKEDWALMILGFCAEAGVVGSVTR